MRVAVNGASGRMGGRVVRLITEADDLELVDAFAHRGSTALGRDVGTLAGIGAIGVELRPEGPTDAEVVIDFALGAGTLALLDQLDGQGLITGVTGLTPDETRRLHGYQGPLIHASNFSTGVNLLLALVEQAAQALPAHDIEVLEAHHNQKRDAPSGTALSLARAAARGRGLDLEAARQDGRRGDTGPRRADEIGIHAIRAGGIIGEHEVWFGSAEETIRLCHSAASRDTFAAGAIRAARWIRGRPPGHYSMRQVLGL